MSTFSPLRQTLNPWFPPAMMPFGGAVIESVLGISLLVGFHTRRAARVAGWIVLAVGIGMIVAAKDVDRQLLKLEVYDLGAVAWHVRRQETIARLGATATQQRLKGDSMKRRDLLKAAALGALTP
jgi:hypothetical protein